MHDRPQASTPSAAEAEVRKIRARREVIRRLATAAAAPVVITVVAGYPELAEAC